MNTILDIIKKYRSQLNKNNFHGDIYFSDDNGQLQIDRAVFNKMIDSDWHWRIFDVGFTYAMIN